MGLLSIGTYSRGVKRLPSPGAVLASIALLLALGGTGYASVLGSSTGPSGGAGSEYQYSVGKLTYTSASYGPLPADKQYSGEVKCPAGEHPLGGGVLSTSGTPRNERFYGSYPSDGTGTGTPGHAAWTAAVISVKGSYGFRVYAICASASSFVGP